MNAFFTLVVLALALFASCQAMGLKDSVAFCDDDEEISKANKALLLSNKPETFANNNDAKSWLSCYYTNLNVLPRQAENDTSEMLCRKAFVLSYPSLWLSGNAALLNCNKQVRPITNSYEQAFAYHKCVLASGFKL